MQLRARILRGTDETVDLMYRAIGRGKKVVKRRPIWGSNMRISQGLFGKNVVRVGDQVEGEHGGIEMSKRKSKAKVTLFW